MMLVNEKIKASEVDLTGLDGTKLGIVPIAEALRLAKSQNADLICTSLMSSPPPCRLAARGSAGREAQRERKEARNDGRPDKVKEIRLTARIEDHDYETKRRQAEKLLASGSAVLLAVKVQGKDGRQAKELLEKLVKDLSAAGTKETGIQLSGKQAAVRLNPGR
ncbi:translation initiation factor IF-3 [Paenibacillus humicola]|uniref:translation initiation factor IF-3 n=1 Tax=Paenibacillus humicola TaxID=3110540 RepID=UPI00237B2B02|nr:translation initiation factor IF-3 [Paenibacillus humicola]